MESQWGLERVFTGLRWFLVGCEWVEHKRRRHAAGPDDDLVFVGDHAAGSGGLKRGDI